MKAGVPPTCRGCSRHSAARYDNATSAYLVWWGRLWLLWVPSLGSNATPPPKPVYDSGQLNEFGDTEFSL